MLGPGRSRPVMILRLMLSRLWCLTVLEERPLRLLLLDECFVVLCYRLRLRSERLGLLDSGLVFLFPFCLLQAISPNS